MTLLSLHPTLIGPLALLMATACSSAPETLRVTLERNTASIGKNRVPNPGFEEVEDGLPKGWKFSPRNTDATFALAPDGRSGDRAVRLTNGTPRNPHVYGQLVLEGGLQLQPGKTYTLSCYVRSDDPGPAWVGGGEGWWMRIGLRGTNGQWKRFSKTFTARGGDLKFPLMINTDGVTEGFDVDDVKLEEGEVATPFLDTGGEPEFELLGELPELIASRTDEVKLQLYLYAPEAKNGLRVSVGVTGSDGAKLAAIDQDLDVPDGLHGLQVTWNVRKLARQDCRLAMRVAQGRTVLASRIDTFELVTLSSFQQAKIVAAKAAQGLDQRLAVARDAGKQVPHALSARALVRHFAGIAEAKLRAEVLPEAVGDLEFLARLAGQAADEVGAVVAGERAEKPVPEPRLENVRIRNGNFWVGNEPVMIVGGMGYGEIKNALPMMRDLGFNTVGDDYDNGYSCLRMMKAPGQHDETAVPKLRESWEQLRKLNLAISFNPTLHYFPEWALHKYPDITGNDPVDQLPDWSGLGRHKGKRTKSYGGFFPFALDSPSLRKLVSEYYAALLPGMADHPALRLVWLMNEPTYASKDAHYVQLYREYLARKFDTVARLNAAWGTEHASFGVVEPPVRSDSPERFDWLTFHQDQVADWFEWLAAEIRKHDSKSLLSNKPMAWTLLQPDRGIDWEREAELWDVPGCDAGRSPGDRSYSFGWCTAAMCFDFQKSVAPDKPLGDFEYHYCHQPGLTENYAYATYWHSYLHGLRWSNFWVWATGTLGEGQAGAGMKHTAWSQPRVAWGTAKAALDLRRLAKYVAAFPGKPEVALYFSRPSLYRDNSTYPGALAAAYEAANGLDAPVGFVTDKMIRAGRLRGVKLLIVPAAKYVETDVLREIREYASGGGHVLLIGECLTVDEYGRKHGDDSLPNGDRVTQVERGAAEKLVPVIDEAENRAGVARPVRCLRPEGKPAWPVECRTVTVDGQRVVSLVGLNKEAIEVQLVGQPAIRKWTDLLTGEAGTPSALTVRPLDVRLLHLG